jgi:probable phosphoglycerate mutase
MRLHLIRHAQSQSNAEGRIQGHLDVPLSEQGRNQAVLLAERLTAMPITALYSSPLQRARTTADAVAAKLSLDVIERDFLMERDVGEIAGLTGPEVGERYPAWREKRYLEFAQDIVPGYEHDDIFRERVIPNMLALIESHPEDEVVVITHGGVIGAFYRHVLGITQRGTFSIANAALSTYEVRNGDAAKGQILTLNDACHLRA